jgi:hypothetical protein
MEEDHAGDSGSWGTACRNDRDRLGYRPWNDGKAGGHGRVPASTPNAGGMGLPRQVAFPARANPSIGTAEQVVDRSVVQTPNQERRLLHFARSFEGSDPDLVRGTRAHGVREDPPHGTQAEGAASTRTDAGEGRIGSDPCLPWDYKSPLRATPTFDLSRATPLDVTRPRCRTGSEASPSLHLAALPSP